MAANTAALTTAIVLKELIPIKNDNGGTGGLTLGSHLALAVLMTAVALALALALLLANSADRAKTLHIIWSCHRHRCPQSE